MRNFKELKIWQKGFDIAIKCFKLTSLFSSEHRFGISSQINRSGVSIPSNVAEGSSWRSDKDYNRFIEIALGSSFELETQLLIAKELNFGDQIIIGEVLGIVTEEQKMLSSFMNSLK